ncbi:hypothetical protein GR925_22350 [Streptomyces sp. HUCO-GS316]|uniref:hypothetical protein n=1 Tax=Streptomyces sp. HUCO-GS316 TaxID=2692198 RepID=UPI0013685419|nr:hypothetical protein [Streptomyces sp. HUCO-GS316]MXM66112.1 hypothetical protein [Streptomyces sp. HUCO-GS316]
MHGNEERDRATGGLTTEDLAQPSGAAAETPEEEETSSKPAIYPGEATATSQADEAGEDESAAGSEARAGAAGSPRTPDASDQSDDEAPQLLTDDEDQGFRDRWQRAQHKFVDDPREAVHDADALVADVMRTLATTFAQHKKDLEDQWGQGDQIETEELRRALRRYRSFFNRLLNT